MSRLLCVEVTELTGKGCVDSYGEYPELNKQSFVPIV